MDIKKDATPEDGAKGTALPGGSITQEELKKLLHYDPETGVFTWRVGRGRAKVGDIAGCTHSTNDGKKYRHIGVCGRRHKESRLAWLYVYGIWPQCVIDHINGDGLDNRIHNLRAVTQIENCRNQRLRDDSTSGVTGVSWNKRCRKWEVYISINRRRVGLGHFTSLSCAVAVRKSAEKKYEYHENHGTVRPL